MATEVKEELTSNIYIVLVAVGSLSEILKSLLATAFKEYLYFVLSERSLKHMQVYVNRARDKDFD